MQLNAARWDHGKYQTPWNERQAIPFPQYTQSQESFHYVPLDVKLKGICDELNDAPTKTLSFDIRLAMWSGNKSIAATYISYWSSKASCWGSNTDPLTTEPVHGATEATIPPQPDEFRQKHLLKLGSSAGSDCNDGQCILPRNCEVELLPYPNTVVIVFFFHQVLQIHKLSAILCFWPPDKWMPRSPTLVSYPALNSVMKSCALADRLASMNTSRM